jgi:hypothetical protein
MSIFKETFRGFVRNQLKTRQNLQSQGFKNTKSNEALSWNLNKQCVIRATSLVDYAEDIGLTIGDFSKLNGNQLSKKFMLQGGVIPAGASSEGIGAGGALYGGIGDFGSAYGNPSLAGDGEDNLDGYGQVPMPGITSLEVETKSAYGSLRRAKINISVHNLRQLEVLELLYLRPGYPIVVEWGWDPYVNNEGELTPQNLSVENLLGTEGKSLFSKDIDQASIYRAIYKLRKDSNGNADAFLGFISNFGFQAREDGGFDCFAELTSMGESLNSLKITPFKIPGKPSSNLEFVFDETDEEIKNPDAIKAIILLLLKYAEDIDTSAVEYEGFWNNVDNSSDVTEAFIDYIGKEFLNLNNPSGITEDVALANYILKKDSDIQSAALNAFINTSYIRWDLLAFLINEFAIPKIPDTPNGESTTELVTSKTTNINEGVNLEPLLYVNYLGPNNKSQLDISCDPTICILPHTFLDEDLGATNEGWGEAVQDVFESTWRAAGRNWRRLFRDGASGGTTTTTINTPSEGNIRNIGGIWLNIRHLLKIYNSTIRDKDNPDLSSFIKKLWDDVNSVCPMHNFVMKIDDEYPNQIYIMDLPVDNQDIKSIENIYTVPVQSSDSIVRSYNLEAKVPDALKSTIAVHAQDPGNPQDLEDVSFNAFNRAIRNRLFQKDDSTRVFRDEDDVSPTESSLGKLVQERQQLSRQYKKLKSTYFQIINGYENKEVEDSGDKISDLKTTLKRLQTVVMQETNLRDREVNTSTVIPLEFSMTFDGVSGIVIGNVFKIKEDRLPRAYRKGESTQSLKGRAEVGFIVFGESQKITAGQDWTTDINGKMILLPGNNFGKERPDNNDFDERGGIYVNEELRGNEGVTISGEQTLIPDDIDTLGVGDRIYLKINGDPTNIRTSAEVDNDVGWYDFDDNVVSIIPAGNKGLLLGTITEQRLQERGDDTALWYKFRASSALETVAIDESSFDGVNLDAGDQFWVRVDVIQTSDEGATENIFNLNNE